MIISPVSIITWQVALVKEPVDSSGIFILTTIPPEL